MIKYNCFKFLLSGLALIIASCATSMSPTEVNNLLPRMTTAKFYTQVQAQDAIKSDGCTLLVAERKYRAPIGVTISSDLKNGARGIDEWVSIDGGNAYYLKSYQWLPLDGAENKAQLTIDFGTMLCK